MTGTLKDYIRVCEAESRVPHVGEDDGDVPHAKCATFDDDGGAYIRFWKIRDGKIVVQSMHSGEAVRGRDMLRWLNQTYRLPVVVVEATPEAMGFWRKMKKEGLVRTITAADGWPSPLEGESVPL
jgi:hypothetical protein